MRRLLFTLLLFAAPAANAQDLIPAEAFANDPGMSMPELSPDGSKVAFMTTNGGATGLGVRMLDTNEQVFIDTSENKVRDVNWATNDIVLLSAAEARIVGARGFVDYSAVLAIDLANDGAVKQLGARSERIDFANKSLGYIDGIEWDTGRVLISAVEKKADRFRGDLALFAITPDTNRVSIKEYGTDSTAAWWVDGKGEAVIRYEYGSKSKRREIRVRKDGSWKTVFEEHDDLGTVFPRGLLDDDLREIAVSWQDDEYYTLYALDTETGDMRRLYEPSGVDVTGSIVDPYTQKILGVYTDGEDAGYVWFDEEMAALQQTFDNAAAGMNATIASWSRDRSRMIVGLHAPNRTTIYFLYDAATGGFDAIAYARPELSSVEIPSRRTYSYPARDGATVPAFLTKWDDLVEPAPLVVLPHGGPTAHDTAGFDSWAHFMASRGYVVLQPQFRGSTGYGTEWEDAGDGEMADGVMQTDVTDGVLHLIEIGMVDPDRICIVGGSYGGYAALIGATFTPELYTCAAAYAPVTDRVAQLDYRRTRFGRNSSAIPFWSKILGDADDAELARISPINHVRNIQIPILLVHGREDYTVEFTQSERFAEAMSAVGREAKLVELDGEDHYLSFADTRREFFRELDAFLRENLGLGARRGD